MEKLYLRPDMMRSILTARVVGEPMSDGSGPANVNAIESFSEKRESCTKVLYQRVKGASQILLNVEQAVGDQETGYASSWT